MSSAADAESLKRFREQRMQQQIDTLDHETMDAQKGHPLYAGDDPFRNTNGMCRHLFPEGYQESTTSTTPMDFDIHMHVR